jgi:NIPSNAP
MPGNIGQNVGWWPIFDASSTDERENTMALYELRTYTLYVGKMAEAVKLYQEIGFPALQKGGQDKKLVGYFQSDTGTINQLVHLWKFDDDADRRAHWAAVYANKDFVEGFASKFRPLLMTQEVKLLHPAPWGPHPWEVRRPPGVDLFDDPVTGPGASSRGRSKWRNIRRDISGQGAAIKIVLDITRLVQEGKLTAQEADRLQALAKRDTGSLAINVLMSFGAVAVAAGIIALEPAFTTGAVLGCRRGSDRSCHLVLRCQTMGPSRHRYYHYRCVVAGRRGHRGCWGRFAGLAFSALLFLSLAVAIRSGFLMALVPLALAGALGSSTGYRHAVYMLTVTEPTITIAFLALLAGAAYLISQQIGQAFQQLAIIFARVSLILVNFGFWIGSLWGDHPGETWAQGEGYRFWSAGKLGASPTCLYRRSRSSLDGPYSSSPLALGRHTPTAVGSSPPRRLSARSSSTRSGSSGWVPSLGQSL